MIVCARMFSDIAEEVFLATVPEDSLAKDKSHRHVINQSFESARRFSWLRKTCVCPCPEAAMAIPTIMSLKSESEWITFKTPAVKRDATGKNRVGMWSARKTNPALIAEGHAKGRCIPNVPGNFVTVKF